MRAAGVIGCSVLAVVAGLAGIFWLGMTGLVWYHGELRETTSFDPSEASLGYGIAFFFWAIAIVLIAVAIVRAVQGARRQPAYRTPFLALAVAVPLGSAMILTAGWFVLLSAGGSSFAP